MAEWKYGKNLNPWWYHFTFELINPAAASTFIFLLRGKKNCPLFSQLILGFLASSVESISVPYIQVHWLKSMGWEDPLEKGMAIHSSIPAWRIPWTEEPGGIRFMGSQRVGHDWSNSAHRHDWNQTPLNTIFSLSQLELLSEGLPLSSSCLKMLDLIHQPF